MGAGPTAPTAPAATDRAPAPRPPQDPERDSLGPADPLLLAGPAARVRQLGDRLQTLPALARLRPLAAPPRPPGRRPRRCVNRSDAVGMGEAVEKCGSDLEAANPSSQRVAFTR